MIASQNYAYAQVFVPENQSISKECVSVCVYTKGCIVNHEKQISEEQLKKVDREKRVKRALPWGNDSSTQSIKQDK